MLAVLINKCWKTLHYITLQFSVVLVYRRGYPPLVCWCVFRQTWRGLLCAVLPTVPTCAGTTTGQLITSHE